VAKPKPASKLPEWLPPAHNFKPVGKIAVSVLDDVAVQTLLVRGEGDAAMHGSEFMACCDCGLKHVVTFELWRDVAGQFVLNHRWIRDNGGTILGRADDRRRKAASKRRKGKVKDA